MRGDGTGAARRRNRDFAIPGAVSRLRAEWRACERRPRSLPWIFERAVCAGLEHSLMACSHTLIANIREHPLAGYIAELYFCGGATCAAFRRNPLRSRHASTSTNVLMWFC